MKLAVLRAILRTQLATVPDLPLVHYEQTEFAAPVDATYLEDELRLPVTSPAAIGMHEARGLYLLTIHIPSPRLVAELDGLPDRLALQFAPGVVLTDVDRTHQVELTSLDPGALRRVGTKGYRRLVVAFTARAFRTSPLPA